MMLEPDFQFSQYKLQDYIECPRRFQLRHIEQLKWPALKTEPVIDHERLLDLGKRFHQMVHQQILGLAVELITRSVSDPELMRWWEDYLQEAPVDKVPPTRLPEHTLATRISGHLLVAKYDLLAFSSSEDEAGGQKAVIIDWKTSSRRPSRQFLQSRLQTKVYPFLLVEAGANILHGRSLQANQIEMIYWFVNAPDDPEHLFYSEDLYQRDRNDICGLIEEISNVPENQFMLTLNDDHCRFCEYRSLCNRGTIAGDWRELEDDNVVDDGPIDLDFDQIGEIAF